MFKHFENYSSIYINGIKATFEDWYAFEKAINANKIVIIKFIENQRELKAFTY